MNIAVNVVSMTILRVTGVLKVRIDGGDEFRLHARCVFDFREFSIGLRPGHTGYRLTLLHSEKCLLGSTIEYGYYTDNQFFG